MEKDNFNANVDFVRGQADMIVLSALSDTDKYGLEILSAIQERSQGMYSLKQATLYSSLKRLEKNGYVHSYDGDISNGAKRVYYGLTQVGREHLENDKSYWEFCNFLMSNLISDNKFDPQNENKPFDPADFRPLTRRSRGEKEDKEQEKEVVVKYVYVKSDDIPEGADVVYVSPENVQEIENNSSVESTQIESGDNDTQNQEITTLSDTGSEYQPSFVLVDDERDIIDSDYDYSIAGDGNVENEVSIIETDVQIQNENAQLEVSEVQELSTEENTDYQLEDVKTISSIVQSDSQESISENIDIIAQDSSLAVTEENVEKQLEVEELVEEIDIVNDAQPTEIEAPVAENVVEDNNESVQQEEANPALEQSTLEQTTTTENENYNFSNRPLRNSTDSSPDSFASIFSNYARENDVNYVESFSELFDVEDEEELLEQESGADIEYLTMKEMVYKYQAKGITIKPYEKRNTMEYYVNRYYFSNKLHFHASLIIFAIFAVELFISHFICNRGTNKISDLWLLMIFALAIFPAIRGVMYVIDPTRKSLANYNPKTSILISLLPVITLPIVFALMAFVQFGANINDYSSMERTIVVPSVLLFNIPLFSLIYTLLYRTYKYHVN
ncbi:MAG: helix-turn-helix transcriptional regulator [Clostridia bacterium]|nr:helix-turn-helix transcriptional regulator [Clostridia bacterium]